MKIPFVDLSRQHIPLQKSLQDELQHLLDGGVLMGGEAIRRFEVDFANYLKISYCISCANATDALEVVLRAWKIGPGHEVIVPANGWMSAAEAVCTVGAAPVFVDQQSWGYCINEQLIKEKISDRTKAIIPIHLYGVPANMPEIRGLAKRYRLRVLEDCAQAHGAAIEGRKVGTWGDAGVFSFYPTKNLGGLGDGGMIVTDDDSLALACRAIAQHGQFERHVHTLLGKNSRMDAFQARILTIKLPFIDRWNARRKSIADYYRARWADLPMVLPEENENSVYHLFVVRVANRDKVREQLTRRGIITEIHYPVPVCQQPIFQAYRSSPTYPQAESQADQLLSIPVFPELTDQEVEYVTTCVREVIESETPPYR